MSNLEGCSCRFRKALEKYKKDTRIPLCLELEQVLETRSTKHTNNKSKNLLEIAIAEAHVATTNGGMKKIMENSYS